MSELNFELRFNDLEDEVYIIDDFSQSGHIITITGIERLPEDTSGFFLSREGKLDRWDYSAFTTIYRKMSDTEIQYSDDGSVYIPPTKEVTVQATFSDGEDAYGIRPDAVNVTVFKDGKKSTQPTLTAPNYTKTYKDRPAESEFTIEAEDIERYSKTISGTVVTYTLEVPQPRSIGQDTLVNILINMYEGKPYDNEMALIYASNCENNILNYNDVPEQVKEIVSGLISGDGFMVNEDGTISLRPIN